MVLPTRAANKALTISPGKNTIAPTMIAFSVDMVFPRTKLENTNSQNTPMNRMITTPSRSIPNKRRNEMDEGERLINAAIKKAAMGKLSR